MTIYKLTNKLNGKVYIGETSNLKNRLSFHKHMQVSSNGSLIGDAIFKDGWYNFYVEVLDIVDTQLESDFLEKKFISEYNSNDIEFGYNNNKGSRGTDKGVPKKELHKIHMSDAAKGKPKSPEHRAAMSAARIGRRFK